jgi:serine/threonine-protein kinase
LSRRVKTAGPLPLAEACELIRQAAVGLEYIHQQGIVHRDIKPSNLALAGGSAGVPLQVKILDLGLARLCEGAGEGLPRQQALTQLGTAMGTTDYMSPEQGRDSRSVDARSDLYSLGCTFYFALAGQPPFPGGSHVEKLMHHQLDEPQPIEKLRPDLPPALTAIVRKLTAKDLAKRYQRAADVAADLLPFCMPLVATPPLATALAIPEARAVAAPEFDIGDTARQRPRRGQGNRLWGGIVVALAVVSFLLVALLRFMFL